MSSSLVESSPTGGHSQGRLTADQMKLWRFIQIGFHLKSSQLFYREIFDRLWYITITERKKARTAKIWLQRSCRFNSCRGHHIAPWCRWLTRLPVTQEIAGSSPVGVAIWPLSSTVERRFKNVLCLWLCTSIGRRADCRSADAGSNPVKVAK